MINQSTMCDIKCNYSFLFSHMTNKKMQWKREFLQGIQLIRLFAYLWWHLVLFLYQLLWCFVLHLTDHALWLKNCLSKFKIWSCNVFSGMFLIKMTFVASNYDEHKKHSAIAAMLKNYLMHDLSCPVPKKLLEKIQKLKL